MVVIINNEPQNKVFPNYMFNFIYLANLRSNLCLTLFKSLVSLKIELTTNYMYLVFKEEPLKT